MSDGFLSWFHQQDAEAQAQWSRDMRRARRRGADDFAAMLVRVFEDEPRPADLAEVEKVVDALDQEKYRDEAVLAFVHRAPPERLSFIRDTAARCIAEYEGQLGEPLDSST
jgi:hypothetical protein